MSETKTTTLKKPTLNVKPQKFASVQTSYYIPEFVEKEERGSDSYVTWGSDNRYSEYLEYCYNNCNTLKSIIDGVANIVRGDKVLLNNKINPYIFGDLTPGDFVMKSVLNYLKYGNIYWKIHFAGPENPLLASNTIIKIEVLNSAKIRSNSDNTVFYYNDNWRKGVQKGEPYMKFDKNKVVNYDSDGKTIIGYNLEQIFHYKGLVDSVYGQPLHASNLKNIYMMMDIEIAMYSLLNNDIANSHIMIHKVNGNWSTEMPVEEQKDIIVQNAEIQNTGVYSYGKIMHLFDEEGLTTEIANIGEAKPKDMWDSNYERCQNSIYESYKCSPSLLGIPTKMGWSAEENAERLQLLQSQTTNPIANAIINSLNRIFGLPAEGDDSLIITPFNSTKVMEQQTAENNVI